MIASVTQRHGTPAANESDLTGPPATSPDLSRIARAVRDILEAVGEDPDREGLIDTPHRVARSLAEMFAGLREDASTHLSRVFHETESNLVVVRDIRFSSTCEHHLLPVIGRAHIGYLPEAGRVVGLSKLARTVEVFARRPQLQERMARQIADAIERCLGAQGVGVVLEAEHMCMAVRGVESPCARTITPILRGRFATDPMLRGEVMSMLAATATTATTP